MSGNGRGNMRPTNRSPPFLVVGLLVAMCILAVNYWSVSSKNKDLANQLESLQVDFRSVSDRHLAVEKRASHLSSQTAEFQSMVSKLQNSATEKDNRVSLLTGEVNSLSVQLEQVRKQGDSQVHQMEDEKKSVVEELARVRGELEDEQRKVVVCDKTMCRDVVRELMKVMLDTVGKTKVMFALSTSHADVLSLIDDLLKTATDPPVQQYRGNLQPAVQGDFNQQPAIGQAGVPVQGGQLGQNSNMGPNPTMGQNPNIDQDPNVGQNPNVGQDRNVGQNPNVGQDPNMGQDRNMDQNPNVGQDPNMGQDRNMDQNPNVGQNLALGQDLMVGQNPNLVQEPNVVQMQQQQQPEAQGRMMGAQDQFLGVLKELPQNMDLNNPQDVAARPQEGGRMEPREEEKGGEQEIVAQNIPQRDVEEPALPNNQQLQDLNALNAQAQEDLNAAPAQEDLPEDEIDMQAKANHVAQDLGNQDENLHDQLQDLSRNRVEEPHNDHLRDMDRMEEQDREDKHDVDREDREEDRREDFEEDNEALEGPLH